jgi:hypothetical protein
MANIGVADTLDMYWRLRVNLSCAFDGFTLRGLDGTCSISATATDGIIAAVTTLDVKLITVFIRHNCLFKKEKFKK